MSNDPKSERKLRVLLIAEAANPKLTSVALIGWSFSRAMAKVADAHLAVELRNRDDLLAAGLQPGEFTAIDNRFWQGLSWNVAKVLRGGTTLGWSTYTGLSTLIYPFFERQVWKQFGSRLRRGEFDLVHRVTPLAPVAPSLLARRCAGIGVPFVFGPLNGGVPWPKEFTGLRKAEKEWMSYFRDAYKLMPGFHATRRHASAILIAARAALAEMPAQYHSKCVYLPENAIDEERFPRREPPAPRQPLSVAFIGRLVPYKGADMLIEAAAPLAREGKLALNIIGDGPELPKLKQMAAEQQIAGRVSFPGWVDHTQMADVLGQSQIFGFPSVHEFGGGVVLEAMALGLVPVVVNYGGPGELVPPGAGFALPMASRAEIVRSLRDCLARLAAAPDEVRAMGRRAQDYVYRNFTWDAKARQVLEVYRWVLRQRADKPDFGMPIR
jgi:glycosyltransferase involved in cell wall biosynthesis